MSEEIYRTAEQRITEIVEQADSNGWTNEDLILHLMGPVNAAISKSRNQALEDAATACDDYSTMTAKWKCFDRETILHIATAGKACAERIRKLKSN